MAFSEIGAKLNFAAYRLRKWDSIIAATENHREKEEERGRNKEGSYGESGLLNIWLEERGRKGEQTAAAGRGA